MATTQTYGLANNGAVPKTSGVLSGLTVKPYNPQQQQSQITNPLTGSGQSSTIPLVQPGTTSGQPLAITQPKPDTTYTHTTTTNNNGGTSTKATPNPSVLKQQQDLNAANITTPGYVPLVTDGLAGPKTQAAVEKYGYNTQTGQPNTPKTNTSTNNSSTTSSGMIPEASKPTTPQVGTPMENAQTVSNSGQQTPQEQTTYQGLVNQSQTESPQVAAARKALSDAQNQVADSIAGIQGSGTWTGRAMGEQAILAQKSGGYLANLQGAVTNALSSQGQQIQAGTAANSAAQTQAQRATSAAGTVLGAGLPQAYPYSSQIINPLTGQPVSGGTSGSLQDTVSSVVQKLNSGQMTYNDALNALSGYGQGGVNELQKQLPPGFNIAQSNTLSGQQGTVKINYELADKALSNVETLMKDLPAIQNTNIPGVNALTQGFSTVTGLGSEQTRAVTGAVQSLRNAYASLLASARGGTPTDYSGQAQAEIPDKPTPNDIAAIRKNFETLGKVRTDILGNPGTSGGTSNSGTVSAGGFNFKLVNGQYVPA